MKETKTIYKEGGFDPTKPDKNILSIEEIEIKVQPIKRVNLFLELSKRNLYKDLVNNRSKLSERSLILLDESPSFDIDSGVIAELITALKITYQQMEEIFYNSTDL